ncbi:MAG: ABC transporter permease subunit [Spirochaetales bacterium]|nr:ABC transporter permease subunit [Spirochaetales bacterium]
MIRSYLFLAFITLLFILPLFIIGIYSISGLWHYPEIIPHTFNIRAFLYIQQQAPLILGSLLSSLFYSLCTVLLTFFITVLPAYAFARNHFRFKSILENLLLAPALLPPITFSMGIHIFFIFLGIADTMIGVILILSFYSYPYMFRSLISGFRAYGREYEICAANLGAGTWERIFRIDFPLILPAFTAGGMIVFLVAFSEYFLVFLIGGGGVPSFSGYLFPFLNSSDRPVASLLTLIFFIIPIVFFVLIEVTVNRMYKKRGLLS